MKFYQRDGSEVEAEEGARIEWDSLNGIGIPGTGVVVSLPSSSDFPPPACLWIDPNEALKQLADQIRDTEDPLPKFISTGLDGTGGLLWVTNDSLWRGICEGRIRILPDRCDPEPYRIKLRARDRERRRSLYRRCSGCGEVVGGMAPFAKIYVTVTGTDLAYCADCHISGRRRPECWPGKDYEGKCRYGTRGCEEHDEADRSQDTLPDMPRGGASNSGDDWKYTAIALSLGEGVTPKRPEPGQHCSRCGGEIADFELYRAGDQDLCGRCACNWALARTLDRLAEERMARSTAPTT